MRLGNSKLSVIPQGEFVGHPVEPTVSSAMRRSQLLGRRMPISVTPQAGEGLPELFFRAMSRNGYQSASKFWPIVGHYPKRVFEPRNFVDLTIDDESISEFLGTPNGPDDIEPLRYVNRGRGVVSFFGTDMKVGRLAGSRRVSPRFLATHGYMKAIWSVLPIGFDPTNFECLLERCPVCDVELKLSKTLGLYSCHKCADGNGGTTDLRDHPQPIVELDSYENLKLCCSLIDPGLAADRQLPAVIHPELRSFGRGEIFELIVLMAFLLDQASGAQRAASCSPSALDRSTSAVRNWPRGIFELNDEVASTTKQSRRRRDFRSPIFDAVQGNHYLFGSDSIHVLRNQIRCGSAPRDLSKEGIANGHRHVLPDRRTWRVGGFDIRVAEERLVYASTVAASSRKIIREHKATGLPIIELVRLYESGLALCPDNDLRGLFREVGDGDLQCKISHFSSRFDDAGVALYDLVNTERTGSIRWSNVLHHVVDGKLPVTVAPGSRPLIRRLRVHNLALAAQIVSESEPGNIFDRVALQNAEAAFYIGVGADISALMSSGLLQPGELTFSVVRQFRKRYVCGAEVARCLELLNYPERSSASIFKRLTREGIASVHSHPKIVHRAAFNEFLARNGY
ncbi:hypothetical protein [Rhizobium sp. BR 315]|uniref:hypothetical protein n=1 Tax=Rhizobium sp. BR 315 TaxID=3040014 RepID=UPI003D34163C